MSYIDKIKALDKIEGYSTELLTIMELIKKIEELEARIKALEVK
ncbi:hypothetical protein LCGC14_2079840 [marine sediment metagenome]|uniref:Uncharacterized protein n=1 Tax=marine sediment metagenome TaxID=412755 RepID=A0A0F9EFT2_9ZZZZ